MKKYLLGLQFFNSEDGDTPIPDSNNGGKQVEFTKEQEEYFNMKLKEKEDSIRKGILAGNKELIEKGKKYDEYLESQKTEVEKKDEYIAKLEKEKNELAQRELISNRRTQLIKSNALDEEFVMFKVEKMVDENTTFDQALEIFKKENPTYFKGTETKVVTTGTGNNGIQTPKKYKWEEILEKKKRR